MVRLGPDFGPKSPDYEFLRKTGLFRTGLSPDSIPSFMVFFQKFKRFAKLIVLIESGS